MLSFHQPNSHEQRIAAICRDGTHPFAQTVVQHVAAIRNSLGRYSCGVVVSGGQTGVDAAGFDVADALGIPRTGFAPRAFINEAGRIPEQHQRSMIEVGPGYGTLTPTEVERELQSPAYARWRLYAERTRLNAQFSDATIIIAPGDLVGGNRVTLEAAALHHGPASVFVLDLLQPLDPQVEDARRWLTSRQPLFFNIAGSRESVGDEIKRSPYAQTVQVLHALFGR